MAMQGINMTAPAEELAVAGSSSSSSFAPVGGDFFTGGVVDPPPSSEDERDHEGAVLGDEEEDDLIGEGNIRTADYEGDDTGGDDVDCDSEFEGDDDDVPPSVKNCVLEAWRGTFLGQPARIATVETTVCFMTLATSSAPPCDCLCHHDGGGEIIVDYRYTRFFGPQSGDGDGDDDGVCMHVMGPKQARLRFVLRSPLASSDSDSDPAVATTTTTTTTVERSSLRFAGAVVASLVYPARFSAQLHELWSVATMMPVPVPARATSLLVTVDAGILRPGDYTPARMWRMYETLASVALECAEAAKEALPDTPAFDVAGELHLPALLRSEDDVRPEKRRRVTGEDCPICCEVLGKGRGLAAWPRCSHIFHGWCLEQHLLSGYQECPLCRSELRLNPAPCGK